MWIPRYVSSWGNTYAHTELASECVCPRRRPSEGLTLEPVSTLEFKIQINSLAAPPPLPPPPKQRVKGNPRRPSSGTWIASSTNTATSPERSKIARVCFKRYARRDHRSGSRPAYSRRRQRLHDVVTAARVLPAAAAVDITPATPASRRIPAQAGYPPAAVMHSGAEASRVPERRSHVLVSGGCSSRGPRQDSRTGDFRSD